MVFNFAEKDTIINNILAEMRDTDFQSDRPRFRRNMKKIGSITAYEISKSLSYSEIEVETPLGLSPMKVVNHPMVIAGILRAGLPLHDGILDIFNRAESAFISTYRNHIEDGEFEVKLEYITSPSIENKTLVLTDPMIATGSTIEHTLNALREFGQPSSVHIATIIASTTGISRIERLFPHAHIWAAAIDDELTAKSYIVPGLGDAGDLCFGEKHFDD